VFDCVFAFLKELKSSDLPFNPYEYIIPRWRLITYTKRLENDRKYGIVSEPATASAFTLYHPKKNEYKIYYNDNENKRRILFTLCHEIAHILLNHLKDFDKSNMSRGGIANKEYKEYAVLETEADVFAKNILVPIHLVNELNLNIDDVYSIFNISRVAAETRCQTLQKDLFGLNAKRYDELKNCHHQFIKKYSRLKRCKKCGSLILEDNKTNCLVCGADIKKEESSVKYRDILLNQNGHLSECLVCDNEDIKDEDIFCKICGNPVINLCSNKNCNCQLDGNARFCSKCSSESLFYNRGVLNKWEKEKYPNMTIEEDLPF
jgi:Zn-dependent peptidase ImmA (M78 family)